MPIPVISSARDTCGVVAPGSSCSVGVQIRPHRDRPAPGDGRRGRRRTGEPQGFAVNGFGRGPGSWTPSGSLEVGRDGATATLLEDGDVLVAGGENTTFPGNGSLSDAELYDPSTGTFTATGELNVARSFASSTLLADGDVLVTGGISNVPSALSSAELYDPATQSWSLTTSMNAAGFRLTDTVLADDDVLVTGFSASSPEVYDPTTATWTDTGPLPVADEDATATLLGDGDVLVAGGATTAAALFDPATNDWSATGSMATAQEGPTATLLGDGDVLVAGGENPNEFIAAHDLRGVRPDHGDVVAVQRPDERAPRGPGGGRTAQRQRARGRWLHRGMRQRPDHRDRRGVRRAGRLLVLRRVDGPGPRRRHGDRTSRMATCWWRAGPTSAAKSSRARTCSRPRRCRSIRPAVPWAGGSP